MKTAATLETQPRQDHGKGAARELRRQGFIPAIIYGQNTPNISISTNAREFNKVLAMGNLKSRILDLNVADQTIKVLPKAIDRHPVTDVVEHVDFLRVEADSTIRVHVKIAFLNKEKAPGIKRGGVLNIVRRSIELTCRADSIPETLEVDLSQIQIGDSVHFSQIAIPEGVEPVIKDRDFTVATVTGRTAKADAEASSEEAEEGDQEASEDKESQSNE